MKVLITRILPDEVVTAARARFDLTLRERTDAMTQDELVASLRDFDAVLPTLGDLYRADVFAAVHSPRCDSGYRADADAEARPPRIRG